MGDSICVQALESEVGRVIDEATVLGSQREVFAEWKVGTASVNEDASRLGVSSGNESAYIAGWVEYKCSAFRQEIWVKSQPGGVRQTHDQAAGHLVNVRLHSGGPKRDEVLLRVPVVAVVSLSSDPAIEPINGS